MDAFQAKPGGRLHPSHVPFEGQLPVSGFLARFTAVFVKEFIQMRRDRLTFAMMVGVPLMQLTLFGFAINADPRNMPTAVVLADQGPYVRSIVAAIRNTD